MTDTEECALTVEEIDHAEKVFLEGRQHTRTIIREICAAARLSVCGQAASEGELVTVPREPTLEMQRAGLHALDERGLADCNCDQNEVYAAMIAAAPTLRDEPIAGEEVRESGCGRTHDEPDSYCRENRQGVAQKATNEQAGTQALPLSDFPAPPPSGVSDNKVSAHSSVVERPVDDWEVAKKEPEILDKYGSGANPAGPSIPSGVSEQELVTFPNNSEENIKRHLGLSLAEKAAGYCNEIEFLRDQLSTVTENAREVGQDLLARIFSLEQERDALTEERDDLQQRVYMLEIITPTEQPLYERIASLERERDALKHDMERYMGIANEHVNEADALRAAFKIIEPGLSQMAFRKYCAALSGDTK